MFEFAKLHSSIPVGPPSQIPTGEGSPPFEMTVTMVVAKYPEYPPIEDGQGTVRVPSGDITANTRILQRFNGVNQNGKSPESLVHDK